MTATLRQPRLLWNGRDRWREAEPVPAQVLEIVRPQREQVVGGNLGTSPLLAPAAQPPQNRLIWTNDNLVALASLLEGDDEHEPLAGKVDLIYIDPPFAVQSNSYASIDAVMTAYAEAIRAELRLSRYYEAAIKGIVKACLERCVFVLPPASR